MSQHQKMGMKRTVIILQKSKGCKRFAGGTSGTFLENTYIFFMQLSNKDSITSSILI